MKNKNLLIGMLLMILMLLCAMNVHSQVKLWDLGTTKEGTSSYVAVGVMCETVNNYADDIRLVPITYTASASGLKGYNKGEVDGMYCSFQQLDMIINGYGAFDPEVYKWEREFTQLVYPMLMEVFFVIKKEDSNKIKSWSDLAGKKLFPMMTGATSYLLSQVALGPKGLNIWDQIDLKAFDISHAADAIKLGEIDASVAYRIGSLVSWAQEIFIRADVEVLEPTEEELEKILGSAPYFGKRTIDTNFLQDPDIGPKEAMKTLPYVGFTYLISPDFDEETVYRITKILFEHADEMSKQTAVWREFSLDPIGFAINSWQTGVKLGAPLHPGVKRYIRELGYDLKELGLDL